MRVDPAKLRRQVYERDRGCCRYCGCDTEAINSAWRLVRAQNLHEHESRLELARKHGACDAAQWSQITRASALLLRVRFADIDARLKALGFTPNAPLWHMHHIHALEEGGTNDLSNLATACTRCHRPLTRELQGRLSRRLTKRIAIFGEDRRGRVRVI